MDTERSAHFVLRWRSGTVTPADREAVLHRAEAAWMAYQRRLGDARMPADRLAIELEPGLARGKFPHVDPESGALVLDRYEESGEGYLGSLAHELVHAIRWTLWAKDPAYQSDAALFFEEGFAETLATDAGFPSDFPLFGRPAVLAAGAWLDPVHTITLPELISRHRTINFRCMPQAYAERLSFFDYLKERAGLKTLIGLAYGGPVTEARLGQTYGGGLSSLADAWRAWQDSRFAKLPDAAAKAADYRTRSPVQYLHACTREELGLAALR